MKIGVFLFLSVLSLVPVSAQQVTALLGNHSGSLIPVASSYTGAPVSSAPTIAAYGYNATGVAWGQVVSGINATGFAGQTCLLTSFNNSSTATATVYLTGVNTIDPNTPIHVTASGSGATAAPTTASAGSGTATCSGTAVLLTGLGATVPLAVDANGNLISSGGGGSGTVTNVSVVSANGFLGSVANPTTTPAITLSMGAITPSSVLIPTFAPANYIAYGDSITSCGFITTSADCYVNHLAQDLNILAPTNRAVSGDMAADVIWRVQSADNPAVASNPNLYTVMIGTNDAGTNGAGSGTWEANYKLFHTAIMAWLGTPATSKAAGSTATATGTCANDTTFSAVAGEACTASASTLTFSSVVSTGAPIDIWYRSISTDAGTWTYAVDGGTAVAINTAPPIDFTTLNSHTSSMGLARITGVASGTHSIVFTQTHAGTMSILAVGSLPSTAKTALPRLIIADVINQLDGNILATTAAYAADAQADVTLLAGDGFNVVLAPMASTLQATTAAGDMANTLHPNDAGHLELYRAIRAATPIAQASSLPITWNSASGGKVTVKTQQFQVNSATTTQIMNLQNTSGTSELNIRSKDSTKYAVTTYFYNNTAQWSEGSFSGICGATNDYCIYGYNSPAGVKFNINSTTGAVTFMAARKGTFVCTGGGTITIANALAVATSDIIITMNTAGGTITTAPAFKTPGNGTNFTVLCGATDTSTYNYNILN